MAFDSSIMTPKLYNPTAVTVTYAASVALDASTGNRFQITATGNVTLTAPTNPSDGQKMRLEVTASGGARDVTLTVGTGAWVATGDDALSAATTVASGKVGIFESTYSSTLNRWIPDSIYQTA